MRKNFLFNKEWFFEDSHLLGEPDTVIWGFIPQKIIHQEITRYQQIEIFKTKEFGDVLCLDGIVQLTTKHEHIYHEMIVHPALHCVNNPKNALIIGGGDGGVLRELLKYPLKKITLVEIDQRIIELSKKYLPSLSNGSFDDTRVEIILLDALDFLKNNKIKFDVIINDSTDCYGPSKKLWSEYYFSGLFNNLTHRGIASFQTGYFKELYALKSRRTLKGIFRFTSICRAFIGCFPFDEYTFTIGSKHKNINEIEYKRIKKMYKANNIITKYYSPEIHIASRIIPKSLID